MTAAELAAAPHFVYRLLAADGVLLYVGCAVNPASRLRDHVSDRQWSDLIAEQTVEGPFSRAEALRREADVITAERPRFNIRHNLTPERPAEPSDEAFLFVKRRVSLSGRDLAKAFFRGDIPLEPTEADVWLWLRKLDVRYHAYPCYRSCRCGTYWSHAFALAEDFRAAQEQRYLLEHGAA